MPALRENIRTRLVEREDGFSIVEALVAILVMITGLLATFQILDAATTGTARAKESQVALNIAQRELEEIRALGYDQLAMTFTPSSSSSPRNPRYRVTGGSFALNRDGTGSATMVVNGGSFFGGGFISGGMIAPGPEPFTVGTVSGRIYRFVVWQNDTGCPACAGSQDYKRVAVAVSIDRPAGTSSTGYAEVQSSFVDPDRAAWNSPDPDDTGVITAQQFFLSDTACEADGSTARQEITGEHLLHNTLGTCASGLQTGSTLGAPDALLLGAPPYGSPPEGQPDQPVIPPIYDYANDFYLEPTPDTDKGVQIRAQDAAGCSFAPTGANPESKIHRWVSDPLAESFVLSGRATFEFNTRSLNGTTHNGRICAYLFYRTEQGSPPIAQDNLVRNTGSADLFDKNKPYFAWKPGNGVWPNNNTWNTVRLDMSFGALTIPAGGRLGLAVSVDKTLLSSGVDAIPVLYDHPSYRTRLEVDTTTPVEPD